MPKFETTEHVPQPKNSKRKVDESRQFDGTSLPVLHPSTVRISRDYGAHFFRWGFAGNFINNKTSVLDVGCGVDCSLSKVLGFPHHWFPRKYVGVDWNKKPKSVPGQKWATFHWEYDFTTRYKELGQFDVVTCFEVIEHMRVPDGKKLLSGVRECMYPKSTFLLSTPVFNGKAAANHIHEWEIPELQEAIENAGFVVDKRFGTFSSAPEIKKVMTPQHREVIKALGEYYSDEVISVIMAPLYPDASRNNMWVCKRSE